MGGWIVFYSIAHAGTQFAHNGTVRLSPDDRVQPDVMLWKQAGGTAHIAEDGYMDGAPELAVEIAASSASIDLYAKKESYRRGGVQEYIAWATEDDRISWFALENGEYIELQPDAEGWTHSRVFPGLRLHTERLLDGDGSGVLPQ